MPRYDYGCKNDHKWELIHPMSEVGSRKLCPECKAGGTIQYNVPPGLNNVTLTDKELKALEFPFGKENMKRVRTVGDVDKVLAKINSNYKWTGGFGR